MEYPEKIYIYERRYTGRASTFEAVTSPGGQPYIHADIHEDEIAKLKAALIEVRDSARSCVPMDAMSTPEQMAMKLTKFARIVNEALEATND